MNDIRTRPTREPGERKPYVSPILVEYGSVAELTQQLGADDGEG